MLASTYLEQGNLKQAIHYDESAVRLYEEVRDISGQAVANNNLGTCYQLLGILDKALQHYEVCLKYKEQIGDLTAVAIVNNNIGEVLLLQGHPERAIEHLEKVVATYEQTGNPLACAGLALVNLSRAYQRLQDYSKASQFLERGISLLRKAGARGLLAEAHLQEAELLLESGQIDTALSRCHRVLRQARQMGLQLIESRGLCILGRIQTNRGQYGQAEANLRQSVTLARSQNADYERGRSLLHLAELYYNQIEEKGNRYRCQLAIRQVITIFQQMGTTTELSQALSLQKAYQAAGQR
jgi:tetratricopeptide (TPR) repeat protein